jgi:hypothetical protein
MWLTYTGGLVNRIQRTHPGRHRLTRTQTPADQQRGHRTAMRLLDIERSSTAQAQVGASTSTGCAADQHTWGSWGVQPGDGTERAVPSCHQHSVQREVVGSENPDPHAPGHDRQNKPTKREADAATTQEGSRGNAAGTDGRMAGRVSCRDMMDFDAIDQKREANVEGGRCWGGKDHSVRRSGAHAAGEDAVEARTEGGWEDKDEGDVEFHSKGTWQKRLDEKLLADAGDGAGAQLKVFASGWRGQPREGGKGGDKDKAEMVLEEETHRARSHALWLMSTRLYTAAGLTEKLLKKAFSKDAGAAAVDSLRVRCLHLGSPRLRTCVAWPTRMDSG